MKETDLETPCFIVDMEKERIIWFEIFSTGRKFQIVNSESEIPIHFAWLQKGSK